MINREKPDFACSPVSPMRPHYGYAPASTTCPPVVSVLTPYYNTDESFLETACSLLRQSFQAWEWVIVDDGSTAQESLARLDLVQSADSRIRVIRQDNRGPAGARNAAFRHSTGRYLCLLDSDDMLEPTFIEQCIWFLESNPEFGFCNSWSVNFGDEEFLWQNGFERARGYLEANSAPPLSVIRRGAFEACGGFDETIQFGHEDWDFWLRMAAAGQWGHTLPEYLEWYRKRTDGRFAQIMDSEGVHSEFESMVQTKYAVLNERFPTPRIRPPEPFESVSSELPFENALAKDAGIKRILLLIPWMVTGGADRVNLDWIELLIANGYQVSVCATLDAHHNWLHEFAKRTPDVFILPNFLRLVDFPRFILHLIHSRQIDSVLITGSTLGYQFLPYIRAFCPGVACVDLCHVEEPHWWNGGHPRFAVGYQDMLDLNIVTTGHLRDWMVGRGGERARIEVCYSGIDLNRLERSASRIDARAAFGFTDEIPVITFAGRICEQKRPRFLAEILHGLSAQGSVFHVLIIGDGELRPTLETLIGNFELNASVQFLGTIDHDHWLLALAASDIFLLPSQYEGISVALLEAMAMGVVPVVAAVGGQSEVVSPETGFIISHGPTELDDYVAALANLIDDIDARQTMGQAATQRIRDDLSRDVTAATLLAILDQARHLAASEPRQSVRPRLALELATSAIEYARMSKLADSLWHDRLLPSEDAPGVIPTPPRRGLAKLLVMLGESPVGTTIRRSHSFRMLGRSLLQRLENRRPDASA